MYGERKFTNAIWYGCKKVWICKMRICSREHAVREKEENEMTGRPLISVIMPVYNNEKYFPSAVQSVLEQEFKDIELVVVDDGSTDGTSRLADDLAASDPRIKVRHQENQWIFASFNNGIQMTSGEYIYILNSDDRLRDGALSMMYEGVRKYHPDIIWTKVLPHACDSSQRIVNYDLYHYDRLVTEDGVYPDMESVRKNWLYFYESKLAFNQANLYRREKGRGHAFRNDVYAADQFFNIDIAPEISSALVLKEPIYDHFLYGVEGMNASAGKYYGYEHKMFHELYVAYVRLFRSWQLYDERAAQAFASARLNNLSNEMRGVGAGSGLTCEEKLEKVFKEMADDVIYQCAETSGRVEELNSRILSGCREIISREGADLCGSYRFVYDYLEAVLRYEKTPEDLEKIRQAVYHEKNPHHIGQVFYERLAAGCVF